MHTTPISNLCRPAFAHPWLALSKLRSDKPHDALQAAKVFTNSTEGSKARYDRELKVLQAVAQLEDAPGLPQLVGPQPQPDPQQQQQQLQVQTRRRQQQQQAPQLILLTQPVLMPLSESTTGGRGVSKQPVYNTTPEPMPTQPITQPSAAVTIPSPTLPMPAEWLTTLLLKQAFAALKLLHVEVKVGCGMGKGGVGCGFPKKLVLLISLCESESENLSKMHTYILAQCIL